MDERIEFAILNIDKPTGPTSFDIAEKVGRMVGARKFSHFGTLDPKVTGVLPIALNRACKLTGFFIHHDKTYVGIMRIHEDIEMKKIQEVINKKFLGKIRQTPPVKSRVKREEREREIYSFELLEQDGKDILFNVKCEGGTYIRKLIDDLGSELGIGAHMLELRRTHAGIFSEEDKNFVNLYDLEKAVKENKLNEILIPGEEALKKVMPFVEVKESEIKRLLTGKSVEKKDIVKDVKLKEKEEVAVFSGKLFLGVYEKIGEILKPKFVRN